MYARRMSELNTGRDDMSAVLLGRRLVSHFAAWAYARTVVIALLIPLGVLRVREPGTSVAASMKAVVILAAVLGIAIVPAGRVLWGSGSKLTTCGYAGLLSPLSYMSGPLHVVGGLAGLAALIWVGGCVVKSWPSLTSWAALAELATFVLGTVAVTFAFGARPGGHPTPTASAAVTLAAVVCRTAWAGSLPHLARSPRPRTARRAERP